MFAVEICYNIIYMLTLGKKGQALEPNTEQTCDLVADFLSDRERFAYVRTYGCQGNEADSERIAGLLSRMGYTITDDPQKADFLLFNTCAIREHAENRVFGNVGEIKHLLEKKKDLIVALCGCMIQQERVVERVQKQYPFVRLMFGTFNIPKLPAYVYRLLHGEKRIVDLSGEGGTNEGLPVCRADKIKAWLPIMYGCNNFCTYCVVPYVRGRERSREADAVLTEAKELIDAGYKEITLLGQNVNSYGKDLETPVSFAELLRRLDALDGDFLLRFMTSHPKDLTSELIDTIAAGKHIAPQLHLPVQSGSTRVLHEMNRRYTRERYLSLAKEAREKIPHLTLTTDIIVGFPGETEEDFADTLSLVKEVGYESMFAFCYSPRPGTPAAGRTDQIPHQTKTRRFAELMALQERIAQERNARLVGQTMRVLIDGVSSREGYLTARTPGNLLIEIEAPACKIGTFADITVTEARAWQLKGNVL